MGGHIGTASVWRGHYSPWLWLATPTFIFPLLLCKVLTKSECSNYWDFGNASSIPAFCSWTYQLINGGDNEHCQAAGASLLQAWAHFEWCLPTYQLGTSAGETSAGVLLCTMVDFQPYYL